MSGVTVELGTLPAASGVLDGQGMLPELVSDELQIREIWRKKIHPDDREGVLEMF